MNGFVALFIGISLTFTIAGCTPNSPEQTADTSSDRSGVMTAYNNFVKGLEEGNMELWLSAHSSNVRFMNPAGDDIVGIDSLRAWGQPFFDGFTMRFNDSIEEMKVSGTVAYLRYQTDGQLTPKAGGDPIASREKGLLVFQAENNGAWKITHNIWTSPVIPEGADGPSLGER